MVCGHNSDFPQILILVFSLINHGSIQERGAFLEKKNSLNVSTFKTMYKV